MTNGLWGQLKNCLPINTTVMFACLKYQIVLWSVGNSCSLTPVCKARAHFVPPAALNSQKWSALCTEAMQRSLFYSRQPCSDSLGRRVLKKEPPAALRLCETRRALIRKGTHHCGSPQQLLIASQVGPQTWHLLALGFGWTDGLTGTLSQSCLILRDVSVWFVDLCIWEKYIHLISIHMCINTIYSIHRYIIGTLTINWL